MNLLANAIDALEEGVGNAFFATSFQLPTPQIRIRTTVDDRDVLISIADNGPGISEEIRQRLFDEFFTTKPEGKGTGLGLSISHRIVTEKHGGKLQCISSVEKGAEFVIQIPQQTCNQDINILV